MAGSHTPPSSPCRIFIHMKQNPKYYLFLTRFIERAEISKELAEKGKAERTSHGLTFSASVLSNGEIAGQVLRGNKTIYENLFYNLKEGEQIV